MLTNAKLSRGRRLQTQASQVALKKGIWVIYGNFNTYRAFTEDWAAPISSIDFLQVGRKQKKYV